MNGNLNYRPPGVWYTRSQWKDISKAREKREKERQEEIDKARVANEKKRRRRKNFFY